jgi:hypothetical protein
VPACLPACLPACQFLIVYWLCDFQGSFILIVLASWGISLAASSIALVVGCVVANAATAAEMAPAIFVPQILFAGFFVRTEQIPVWLRWSQWLCGIKYTLNLILIVEFDPALDSCQGALLQAGGLCRPVINFLLSAPCPLYSTQALRRQTARRC